MKLKFGGGVGVCGVGGDIPLIIALPAERADIADRAHTHPHSRTHTVSVEV